MIKTVFLDLDDTILDFKKSERCAISQALITLGIEPTEDTVKKYSEINSREWKLLELGKITRERLKIERFEILFSHLGVERSAPEAKDIYEGLLGNQCFLIDGAISLLESIYKKYDLYLASNGTTSVQKQRIATSGIEKYFKEIFISQEIGHNKPSLDFFEYCFKRIENFDKSQAIIIGDSLSSDIRGGLNAGIKTCLFCPDKKVITGDVIPDYTVSLLSEIPNILSEIQV